MGGDLSGTGRRDGGGGLTVLIIGPTPPPLQGQAVFTAMLVAPGALDRSFHVVHLDTTDRRSVGNMGQLDLRNVRLALLHTVRLTYLIRRYRPQVVFIGVAQNRLGYLRDAVFMAVAKAFRCRLVTQLHGSSLGDFYRSTDPLMRWVVRTTSGWVDAAAVLSPRLTPVYHGLVPPDRLRAVAAGIPDPLARAAGEVSPPREVDRVVVGYLGTLYRPKGFMELIEAASLLDRDEPGRYQFRFAGEWNSESERREALALVSKTGLHDTVEFRGPVTGAEKAEFLRALDILVFPGYQPEGLPLVVLEAMAAGRPVVATPVGAIADVVIPGETGELVPPRDPAALAGGIRRLGHDPATRARYGAAGRDRYLAEYTEEKCVERMIELLRFGAGRVA